MRRRKRLLFLYAGLSTGILLVTVIVLQASGVLGGIVEDFARRYINPDLIRLAGADLDLPGGRIRLRGFELSGDEKQDGTQDTLVEVENIELDVDPLGASLRKIHLEGLQLHLRWGEDGLVFPDLDSLLSEQAIDAPARPDRPEFWFLRRLAISDSTVRIDLPETESIVLTDLSLETLPAETEGGARDEIVLEGRARLFGEHVVNLSGTGTTTGDSFRVFLDLLDAPLAVLPRIAPRLREAMSVPDRLAGRLRRLTLWTGYQRDREEPWRFGGQLDLAELDGHIEDFPYALHDAEVKASFHSQSGGVGQVQVRDASVDGDLTARAVVRNVMPDRAAPAPELELEITIADLLIDERLREALQPVDVADRVLGALAPRGGRGTGRFVIERDFPRDGSDPRERVAFDLELDGTSIELRGFERSDGTRAVQFPMRIESIDGAVKVRPGEVVLQDLEGEISGGRIALDGDLDIVDGKARGFRFDIDGTDVRFRPELRDALDVLVPGLASHWDDYAPEGRSHFRVRLRPNDDPTADIPVRVDVKLLPVAASAAWRGFPVRVRDIRGAIDIGPDGVSFDLEGSRDGEDVTLHGRFPRDRDERRRTDVAATDGDEYRLGSELWLRAPRLECDEEIRDALFRLGAGADAEGEPTVADSENVLRQTWQLLDPVGTTGCELALWKTAEDEAMDFDLRLDVQGAEIRMQSLPLPIANLEGPVFVHRKGTDTRIDISAVRGEIRNVDAPPARLMTQGTILAPADGEMELEVVSLVRGLELTDELATALATPGPTGKPLFPRENWELLAPSGIVDVLLRQTQVGAAATPEVEMKIQLRGVRSDLERLPYPLTATYGEVVVDGAETRFRDVRGMMRGVEVLCPSGEVYPDGDATVIHAEVSAEDFPVDDNMANLMVGPIRSAYLDRRLRGKVQVRDLDVSMRIPQDVEAMRVELDGQFQAKSASMIVGAEITDIQGTIRIDEAEIDQYGGRVIGSVDDGQFTLLEHPVRECSADFIADSYRLRLLRATGRVHGGVVSGYGDGDAMVYEFSGLGTTRASLAWKTVYLRDLLEAVGFENADYQGQLEGHLVLEELVGSDIVNAEGTGRLHITEGNLGEVPLFTEIYKILKPRARPRFTEIGFDADFRNRQIEIDDLRIVSGLFEARGDGTIDMGGNLDMQIAFPDLLRGPNWLLLPEVISQLANQVVSFEVVGPMRSPTARPSFVWSGPIDDLAHKPLPSRLDTRRREDF